MNAKASSARWRRYMRCFCRKVLTREEGLSPGTQKIVRGIAICRPGLMTSF